MAISPQKLALRPCCQGDFLVLSGAQINGARVSGTLFL